jgi:hypothetical protein
MYLPRRRFCDGAGLASVLSAQRFVAQLVCLFCTFVCLVPLLPQNTLPTFLGLLLLLFYLR